MANSLSFTPVATVSNPTKPGILIGNTSNTIIKVVKVHEGLPNIGNNARFQTLETKAKVTL
ncbi:4-methyl-5-nitrocatechol 5-monooxygenase [Bienertia sinuspersici]